MYVHYQRPNSEKNTSKTNCIVLGKNHPKSQFDQSPDACFKSPSKTFKEFDWEIILNFNTGKLRTGVSKSNYIVFWLLSILIVYAGSEN